MTDQPDIKTPTNKQIAEYRDKFMEKSTAADYWPFLGGDPVNLYSFRDDPISSQYVSCANILLYKNDPRSRSDLDPNKIDEIDPSDIKGRKIIFFSHSVSEKYGDFIREFVNNYSQKQATSKNDVRYVIAEPYKIMEVDDIRQNGKRPSNGGNPAQTNLELHYLI
jgi:hypothetical protein